jgi:hypothetical protein
MNWKSTAAVSGVTLLATWLGWVPSRESAVSEPAVVARDARPAPAADIQDQAARLQNRVRTELGYHDPARNPFRFKSRPAAPAPVRVVAAPVAPIALMPAPLPFSLSGMATHTVDGQAEQTAILTSGSDVLFVKQGDRVSGYTVTRVDEVGVDVTAADGTVRRLTLTP